MPEPKQSIVAAHRIHRHNGKPPGGHTHNKHYSRDTSPKDDACRHTHVLARACMHADVCTELTHFCLWIMAPSHQDVCVRGTGCTRLVPTGSEEEEAAPG